MTMYNPVKGIRMSKYMTDTFTEVQNEVKRRTGNTVTFSTYVRKTLINEMERYLKESWLSEDHKPQYRPYIGRQNTPQTPVKRLNMIKGKNLDGESYVDKNGVPFARIKNIWRLFNWTKFKANSNMNELTDMLDNPSLVKTYGLEQLIKLVSEAATEVHLPFGDMNVTVKRFDTYLNGLFKG